MQRYDKTAEQTNKINGIMIFQRNKRTGKKVEKGELAKGGKPPGKRTGGFPKTDKGNVKDSLVRFSIWICPGPDYLRRMLANNEATDTRMLTALNMVVVLEPISELRAFVLFGVT